MQLLILVTLALTCTWISSVLVIAHPILDTSIIVPRAKRKRESDPSHAQPVPQAPASGKRTKSNIPDITKQRAEYWNNPWVPQEVTFAVAFLKLPQVTADVRKWRGIPNFVAFHLQSDGGSSPRDVDLLASWPVLVTAYTKHKPGPSDWTTLSLAEKRSTQPSTKELEDAKKTWSQEDAIPPPPESYPVLYAAEYDNQEYDVGTSVWQHLLYILQTKPGPKDVRYYKLITQIALANSDLSEMLYFDRKFKLLSKEAKSEHQRTASATDSYQAATGSDIKEIKRWTLRKVITEEHDHRVTPKQ